MGAQSHGVIAVINWDRVNELCEEVGHEDFLEVVDIFLEEVDEVIDRLGINPDPCSYEVDLHFLKGSALNLGFDGLATLCDAGEITARNGGQDAIDITPVIDMYAKSKTVFLAEHELRTAA